MELSELQNLWLENNAKMDENIRINREILKQLLQRKPERRIVRIKYHAIWELVLPLILLPIIIPQIKFRDDILFYLGTIFFGAFCILSYYWAIRYFLKVMKIDFSNPIILLKRQVAELERFKMQTKRVGYLFTPFVLAAVFMMTGTRIQKITPYTMLPIFLIVIIMAVTFFITTKYTISGRFRKLNEEISELEKLSQGND
ncbi:MAG TPA: hypothetical protein PKH79_02740 [Prolixibacteraceae bacterium]|nr:hypothetical protein [Prolixibacteraceae bacterium]HPS12806.1 hypothetical protein [Prolixibacteraceae bacterium]